MKVISRLKGGLGNQLFCYAAARRLAVNNNSELVLDNVTGFSRDKQYNRNYILDRFNIDSRIANANERMQPFERYRRVLRKSLNKYREFDKRNYISQEGFAFDERLVNFKMNRSVYLDGLWQSEKYFSDIEYKIREDLKIILPMDEKNQLECANIRNSKNSVALHVRWFNNPDSPQENNIDINYYNNAIDYFKSALGELNLFIFSDNPTATQRKLQLAPSANIHYINHNTGNDSEIKDFWLMKNCTHFVIANSTYSWWAAWLSESKEKIVVAPKQKIDTGVSYWNFEGQIPDYWKQI